MLEVEWFEPGLLYSLI